MKKNYIFSICFCIAASTAFTQKTSFVSKTIEPVKISGKDKSTCDTLWQNADNWSPPTIFSSINGGYVGGHNGYGDKQKVQQILYSGSNGWEIMGTILWFGGKKNDSGNPNSKITVHTYNLNGTGASSAGLVSCPNTKLNTEDLLISDCDTSTGNWNVITFGSPVFISGDFGVGISLVGSAPGDTIGLVASNDGGALYTDFSWEQWSDNSWNTPLEPNNWALNIDWAIFPIYCEVEVGMLEQVGFSNGIKFSTYPNPTVETLTLLYEIQNNSDVAVEIRDLNGKKILVHNEGNKNAGKHSLTIDASEIAAGQYIIAVKAGNKMIAQTLSVVK